METLIVEETNDILDVRLNRPDKRNAMNQKMIEELTGVFSNLGDRNVRGVLLSGVGKSFCAGADLEYMQSMVNFSFSENQQDAGQLFDLFDTIANCPLPVVAKVHGHVMGGALGLVAVSDAVAALADTKFAFSEVHLGLVPATISPFVTARMTPGSARELMMSGMLFGSDRALQSGLVSFVGRELEVDSYVKKTLESFLKADRNAVEATKNLIQFLSVSHTKESVKDTTTNLISKHRVSPEGQERLKNFLDRKANSNE